MKIDSTIAPAPARTTAVDEAALRQAAQEFEAAFLAEMLKPMGSATARQSFGGGIGEEQYASFMLEAQAKAMVQQGGIGLSESIFEALKARAEAAGGEK
ncbi:rod-binding protein [Frigidibacter sp. RF13]|uniref:rod-binding protein n=1 Tax=Frigidibacter sp. RF13 TaxID=2997340 RepID=UPI002270AEF2|nr:rod-binding protein [Frigidibacter sp. RF13]MCY1128711.1 rod-binding protein [Frigidibacter sp. RF13]